MALGRKEKSPLEEVKNLLEPLARLAQDTPSRLRAMPPPKPSSTLHPFPLVATPVTRPAKPDYMPSAMKGVVLTTTGEVLATPTPAALANLFNNSPKVGLNFAKIFDFGDADDDDEDTPNCTPSGVPALDENHSPPPSPSSRKEREKVNRLRNSGAVRSDPGSSKSTSTSSVAAPPTRLRRPSIRTSSSRSALNKTPSLPSSVSDPTGLSGTSPSSSTFHVQPKPLPHPHLPSTTTRAVTLPIPQSHPSPEYDLADEENLPSPFLKRTIDRRSVKGFTSVRGAKKRPGSGHSLRAVAAANAAGRRSAATSAVSSPTSEEMSRGSGTPGIGIHARPSVTSARKAGEEARKALSRS
jgi:NIMA (never in mitosis gene a)-related kinase